jgi:acetate kinase
MAIYGLVINTGSSSIKFGVYALNSGSEMNLNTETASTERLYSGVIDFSANKTELIIHGRVNASKPAERIEISRIPVHSEPISALFSWLESINFATRISAVGHRIVHGGDHYNGAVVVNPLVLTHIERLIPFAPLHQPHCLASLKSLLSLFPNAPHIACFDTAFHQSMPALSRRFAIPRSLDEQGIKPYGFHGLSYEFIATQLATYFKTHALNRVLVLHLGSGASLCALRDGKSIATTMTFSPLDGLPMATRCGSIDAGAILYMASELQMPIPEISRTLNQQSGLLALSGISGDIRQLYNSPSPDAEFALAYFIDRISREIGAMAAVLQGIDAIVFTGGIGFHSAKIRSAIVEQMHWLGVKIDTEMNNNNTFCISTADSKIKLLVQQTDEELMMAKNMQSLLTN